jgi:tetratricopeptide (TPR) repeat protein
MSQDRFQEALALHQRGQLALAKPLYEQVLVSQPRHVDALHMLGVIAAQSGEHETAVQLIGGALELNQNNAAAHFNRAASSQALGRLDSALADYDQAIALSPDFAEAYNNRGLVLRARSRLGLALDNYDSAIAIRADFAQAHFNRGVVLHELGQLERALASCDRALAIDENYFEAHFVRGNVLVDLNRLEAALGGYDRCLALRPAHIGARANRGNVLFELRRPEAALADYDRVIALAPDDPVAFCNRANALKEMKRMEAALAAYERAIELKSDFAEAYSNRGAVLRDLGEFDGALQSCATAILLKPEFAEAHSNHGAVLHDLGQLQAALASHARALALRPDFAKAHCNRSFTWLLAGNFQEGWREHEWRWRDRAGLDELRRFPQPLWLGEQSIAGRTILLHAEQGLGDTIQFSRCVSQLAELGANVILEVQPSLKSLMSGLDGAAQVLARGETLPAFDAHCPLLSLPLALNITLDTIRAQVPYINGSTSKRLDWRRRLAASDKLKVGLVWSGGARLAHQPDLRRRDVPLADLAALRHPQVEFFSLQKGAVAEKELRDLVAKGWDGPPITDCSAQLHDFSDTAGLVENLDLVISVDTSTAHLAGALGKRVWLLNRYDTCWRWLQDRGDSPWYPTLRIYRQTAPGDWSDVVRRVRTELERLLE